MTDKNLMNVNQISADVSRYSEESVALRIIILLSYFQLIETNVLVLKTHFSACFRWLQASAHLDVINVTLIGFCLAAEVISSLESGVLEHEKI